jgi:hypothetical protein
MRAIEISPNIVRQSENRLHQASTFSLPSMCLIRTVSLAIMIRELRLPDASSATPLLNNTLLAILYPIAWIGHQPRMPLSPIRGMVSQSTTEPPGWPRGCNGWPVEHPMRLFKCKLRATLTRAATDRLFKRVCRGVRLSSAVREKRFTPDTGC